MRRLLTIFPLLLIVSALTVISCGGGGGGGGNPVDPGDGPYTVSGTVTDANGNGVAGVTITFTAPGQNYTKSTGSNGVFNFSFQDKATFSVTAAYGSFDITPGSRQVTVDKNITGVDFTLDSTIIRFTPVSAEVSAVDETATVDIMVDNVSSLSAAGFTITYNPAIVEVTDVVTSGEGFMFTDAGATSILPYITYDNELGRTTFLIGSKVEGDYDGADGSGKIATVTFLGKATGTGNLGFVTDGSVDLVLSSYISVGEQDDHVPLTYTGSITVK